MAFENETVFKELAIKAQAGDAMAYNQLLMGIYAFLKRFLRKRIFEHNEIEEVVQEVLLAVHKSLHTYDPEKFFMGWFMAIVEFKIIDYIRSLEKKKPHVDLESISKLFSYANTESDLKLDFDKAFNKLPTKEKDVLSRIKIEGQTVNSVALELNMSESNVKVIAHRAFLNLKKHLGG